MFLEINIKGICDKFGLDYSEFLADMDVEDVLELTVDDLKIISEEYNVDLHALMFKPTFLPSHYKDALDKIKLLVLDVDGVMTDGGMYFGEGGEEMKKFNTKDGMAIIHLTKNNFQVAIISSGFKGEAVKRRADMLGIQYCTVNREPKKDRLLTLCEKLNLNLENVAMIGDDINDLEVMKLIGATICPSDAVQAIKDIALITLETKGGYGCVREFIDNYLLDEPLTLG